MSFDLNLCGGYGSGIRGDIEIADGAYDKLNSYVRITSAKDMTVTFDSDTLLTGSLESFTAGTEILIHVSAGSETDKLGDFTVAAIQAVSGNVLTLDKKIDCDFDKYFVQAVTIAHIDCLFLNDGALLTPPPYNPFKFRGGILAFKVKDTLKFGGGDILLTDCGIPTTKKSLRPLTEQENAVLDSSHGAGEENFMAEKILLNCGDGAAFIIARKIICRDDARIGNVKTYGKTKCRGASDSYPPANVTNIGGSSIFIAAKEIQNFSPNIIAKYRSADSNEGRGLCRCYISSETVLPCDEGLYSFDRLKNTCRVSSLNVTNFGDGSFGNVTNPRYRLNNFAKVLSFEGYRLTYDKKTRGGLAALQKDALVLVTSSEGKFFLAKVLEDDGAALVLNFPAPKSFREGQVISVPQFANFTLSEDFTHIPGYFAGIGGIAAIAVSGTCNLSGGIVNVEGKGREEGFSVGNAQMADSLPVGSPHGSVFILAKTLVCNANTRIGIKEPDDFLPGANVFIAAETLQNFSEKNLGKGLNPLSNFKNPEGGFAFVYGNIS